MTAEHVYPWMWEDYGGLRGHREAAEMLADHPWPRLYDADRLRRNEVPVAATIYVNDLYVERDFAEETADTIRGIRVWETDEFEHNGLRADNAFSAGSSTWSAGEPDGCEVGRNRRDEGLGGSAADAGRRAMSIHDRATVRHLGRRRCRTDR